MTVRLASARCATLVAVATISAHLLSGPAVASDSVPPPDEKPIIEVSAVNGTGCKPGTVTVAVSLDNTAFTVSYKDYVARVGVGAKPTDFRKNCQLGLVVKSPPGFTYAISQTDFHGYGQLASGATGVLRASHYYAGMGTPLFPTYSFKGPLNDNWHTSNVIDKDWWNWVPCGQHLNLNVNTELRANKGTSDPLTTTSVMSMDSTDSDVDSTYHLAWRHCG